MAKRKRLYWYYLIRYDRPELMSSYDNLEKYWAGNKWPFYRITEETREVGEYILDQPELTTPFTVEHNGKVIFQLTNPEHIAVVTAHLLLEEPLVINASGSVLNFGIPEIATDLLKMYPQYSLQEIVSDFVKQKPDQDGKFTWHQNKDTR